MMCFGGLGLGCTHCVASSATPAATKTCENAADRGPTREHGNLHQCDYSFISIIVFFADNFVQYGTNLPHIK